MNSEEKHDLDLSLGPESCVDLESNSSGDDNYFVKDLDVERSSSNKVVKKKKLTMKSVTSKFLESLHSRTDSHHGLSSLAPIPPEAVEKPDDINKDRLLQSLADSIRHSMEVSGVEVWALNSNRSKLYRAGHYVDPEFSKIRDMMEEKTTQIEPGSGVAGHLWSQAETPHHHHDHTAPPDANDASAHFMNPANLSSVSSSFRRAIGGVRGRHNNAQNKCSLKWVDLRLLSINPHAQEDQRLTQFVETGLIYGTGVPFDFHHGHYRCKGIVLYFAHASANESLLLEESNPPFLKFAADHIGSTLALSESRRLVMDTKKATMFIKDAHRQEHLLNKHSEKQEQTQLSMFLNKTFSPNLSGKPPAPMPWRESIWTFFGSFVSLAVLTFVRDIVQTIWAPKFGENIDIMLGPMGALIALQFSLTAAPAAQPRNIIYGTIVSGCITLFFTALLRSWFQAPLWITVSLATSVSIATMAKLGLAHPPAGGLAIVLSLTCGQDSDNIFWCWINLFLYMFANLIAIFFSTIINNMNEKRQYPHYWSLVPSCSRSNIT